MNQKSGSMLELIMDRRNVEKALLQVERNKGVGGVDGMQTDELRDYLYADYQQLRQEILTGSDKPSPVKKVEIPKPQGGVRMLGIPTVDRPPAPTSYQPMVIPILRTHLFSIQLWFSPQQECPSSGITGTDLFK